MKPQLPQSINKLILRGKRKSIVFLLRLKQVFASEATLLVFDEGCLESGCKHLHFHIEEQRKQSVLTYWIIPQEQKRLSPTERSQCCERCLYLKCKTLPRLRKMLEARQRKSCGEPPFVLP